MSVHRTRRDRQNNRIRPYDIPGPSRRQEVAESDAQGAIDEQINQEEQDDVDVLTWNNRLLNNREQSSYVWTKMKLNEQRTKAICTLCKRSFTYTQGTSNLRAHLKDKHFLTLPKVPKATAGKNGTGNRLRRNAEHQLTPERVKELDESCLLWLVNDNLPFHKVTTKSIKRHYKKLAPEYDLPSETKLNSILPEVYADMKKKLTKELQGCPLAITSDGWTAFGKKYLSATVHYIKEGELHNGLLACRKQNVQRAEQVAGYVKQVCAEFQIDIGSQLMCVTTDNANNMLAAQKLIGARYNIGCYAHQLNLAAKDCEDLIAPTLERVKEMVGYFKRVPEAQEDLDEKQGDAAEDHVLHLIQSVETRWLSTRHMFERALQLQTHIETVANERGVPEYVINSNDALIMTDVVNSLDRVQRAINAVSAEKQSTAGLAFTLTQGLTNSQRSDDLQLQCNTLTGVQFEIKLNDSLKTRLEPYLNSQHLRLAALLDPRFRHVCFSSASVKGSTVAALTELVTTDMAAAGQLVQPQSRQLQDPNGPLSYMNERATTDMRLLPPNEAVASYLNVEKYPILANEDDIFDFWRTFPHSFLKNIAYQFLVLCPTSVSSERLFSDAGDLLVKKRNRLLPTKVDQLLFLKKNEDLQDLDE